MTSPVQVRCALLTLRDAGFDRARHVYELTATPRVRINLIEFVLPTLKHNGPFFGTPAAPVPELGGKAKIEFELAIVVLGD